MKSMIGLLLALAAGLACAQEEREICPGDIPPGWTAVGTRTCPGCCGHPGQMVNMVRIRKTARQQHGTRMEVCPGNVPNGWAVIGSRPCPGCCGQSGQMVQMLVIERL